jgi:monoamine oxidase
MSKTPLFQTLRRVVQTAHALNQMHGIPNDERLERLLEQRVSRRRVLKGGLMAGTALTAGGLLTACGGGKSTKRVADLANVYTGPRVAIAGAGLAGLTCAHYLAEKGIPATLYEGSARTGGRVLTVRNRVIDNWPQELGGEFFDSDHEEIFALTKHYRLDLDDRFATASKRLRHDAVFFDGEHHSEESLIEAFRPLASRIAADYEAMGDVVDFENEGGASEFDNMSISAYLDHIGASGVIRKLIEVAYVIEFGLDANDQSALNLIFLISTEDGKLSLYGDSDERYRIHGGNQSLPDKMAERFESQIQTSLILESVRYTATDDYLLTFLRSNGTAVQHRADFVVLALPFTMLREIRIDVEMPEVKRRAIRDLGYGANSKLLLGFSRRVWERQGYLGGAYTDEPIQSCWNNADGAPGIGGSLTVYTGGSAAIAQGRLGAQAEITTALTSLDKIFSGTRGAFTERATRFHWPSHPFSRGSYSAYRVGQWTRLAGAEGLPVGNLHFAGEHCSYEYQGFMNGAAESGRVTAERIIAQVEV